MQDRTDAALRIATSGGALARNFFDRLASLEVQSKGLQDFVTEADREVELHVRKLISEAFPDDGIVGEEHAPKVGTSGYAWVIDPIDGTANFVNAMPAWCVVLAVVKDDQTVIGVIHDPIHAETFEATRGHGARLNGATLINPADTAISRGSVGTGYASRQGKARTLKLLDMLLERDGVFHRNGSGALSLAYAAAGRLIGFMEEHMNAWDCLAGQLIMSEAGGRVEAQSADAMIAHGGRVVVGSAGVFDELVAMADIAYEGAPTPG